MIKANLISRIILCLVLTTIIYHSIFLTIKSDERDSSFCLEYKILTPINTVNYLIVTSNQFLEEVEPLGQWKNQRGLKSSIETIEEISENYEGNDITIQIRHCIRDYFHNNQTKWVVLAGGENIIPTKSVSIAGTSVSCDSFYSNLDDDWLMGETSISSIFDGLEWVPEVYVGRLPADNEDQMVNLVNRIIDYEKNPPIGSWMNTALFGGTFANFHYDINDNNISDDEDVKEFDTNKNHNWINDNIIPSNWDSILLGEAEGVKTTDYYYDYPTNEANLVNQINSGAGVIQMDAHGSPTEMFRSIFTNDVDGDGLFDWGEDKLEGRKFIGTSTEFDTQGKNGLFFLAACSTGTFTQGDCLTEYIVRNCGIGCIGSSHSSYYDNEIYTENYKCWVTQGLLMRFWNQFFTENTNHPGKALAQAKNEYCADAHLDSRSENSDLRTLSQYNLMGDPEVPIWTSIPSQLICKQINNSEIVVVISDDELIADTTITLVNSTYYWKGTTDDDGKLTLPDNIDNLKGLSLTSSKNNYLPFQEELENLPTTVSIPSESNSSSSFPLFGLLLAIAAMSGIRKKRINK